VLAFLLVLLAILVLAFLLVLLAILVLASLVQASLVVASLLALLASMASYSRMGLASLERVDLPWRVPTVAA
jgi:hypothetical protein